MENYCLSLRKDLQDESVTFTKTVSGGIINKAALFTSATGSKYFVKYNDKPEAGVMFQSERASLQILHSTGIVCVPKSLKVCQVSPELGSMHVLEFVDNLQPLTDHWALFGQQIARLHQLNSKYLAAMLLADAFVGHGEGQERAGEDGTSVLHSSCKFGVDFPHFIGTFRVEPCWRDTWPEYFLGDILNPLMEGLMTKYADRQVQEGWSWLKFHLHKVFDSISIHPSLNHGDLCPANFGQTLEGPILFDPAVNFAHSELDLILADAEGGFSPEFFKAYHELMPKTSGFEDRLRVYRLFYYVACWYHVDEDSLRLRTIEAMAVVMKLLQT